MVPVSFNQIESFLAPITSFRHYFDILRQETVGTTLYLLYFQDTPVGMTFINVQHSLVILFEIFGLFRKKGHARPFVDLIRREMKKDMIIFGQGNIAFWDHLGHEKIDSDLYKLSYKAKRV